jgi:hypothetical protein
VGGAVNSQDTLHASTRLRVRHQERGGWECCSHESYPNAEAAAKNADATQAFVCPSPCWHWLKTLEQARTPEAKTETTLSTNARK